VIDRNTLKLADEALLPATVRQGMKPAQSRQEQQKKRGWYMKAAWAQLEDSLASRRLVVYVLLPNDRRQKLLNRPKINKILHRLSGSKIFPHLINLLETEFLS
jgi:hypothetical protein